MAWDRYILEAQGYDVKHTMIHQDNQSLILLIHGRVSSKKKTRHIKIRYFFFSNRVKSGEVSIVYCPNEMLADYLTKPLQGAKFIRLQNRILNEQETKCDGPSPKGMGVDPLECVGQNGLLTS